MTLNVSLVNYYSKYHVGAYLILKFVGLCKCFCSRDGILINNVLINKGLLGLWLERLTDEDWSEDSIYSLLHPNASVSERIQSLLSPKDAQDVPRAIKLLSLVSDLRKLDHSSFDPSEHITHQSLSLLGEMLEALIEPFINPDFSISEQITSLIKFAHIACALFLKHETSFLPLHLYSDLQCMVRTAIFRVAHTKILDPESKVFICLLGDDVLEVLFGRVRMIGGHSPNIDIEELRDRIGSALRLDEIFQKYPNWEQRPRRLKLKRSRDVDHLSPRHWRGELRASTCNLPACWADGVHQAETLLTKYGCPMNFSEHFSDGHRRGVDLMRPKGGKYPGISAEVDRSLPDVSEGGGDAVTQEIELNLTSAFQSFDGKAAYDRELEERQLANTGQFSIWMELEEGRLGHKKTILRLFMDSSLDVDYNKSHDRLLRVRYFSIGGDKWDRSTPILYNAASGSVFCLGSLYATLISTNNKVSLAILQCTSIKSSSRYLDRAPCDEINLPDSAYDVTGQILSLLPFVVEEITSSAPQTTISWAWNSHFVALEGANSTNHTQQPSAIARLRHLSFSVNGYLVFPLQSSHFQSVPTSSLISLSEIIPATLAKTWVITDKVLKDAWTHLFTRVSPSHGSDDMDSDNAQYKIPIFGDVRDGLFPYRYQALTGSAEMIEHSTTTITIASAGNNAPQPCHICSRQVSGPDRQNHMGRHILHTLRGVKEDKEGFNTSLMTVCAHLSHFESSVVIY